MTPRGRLVGINHVALEVGDLDAALEFYGRVFDFELRGRVPGAAFLDMGDQFLALSERAREAPDELRHFGLVVDDKEAAALVAAGVEVATAGHRRFGDPWGNQIEVVDYRDVQFSKAAGVLRGMGLERVVKSPQAARELERKGLGEPP